MNLSASDDTGVTAYYLSTSSSTPSASASGWTSVTSTTSYSASVSYTLSSGDGTKTVYGWYKDSAGNVSSAYSDSIILDATAPTNGTLTATVGDAQVSLNWSGFSDATSGIGSYTLVYSTTSTPSSCSSGTQIYSGTGTSYIHSLLLTNNTTYYYRLCAADNAGNTSTGTTASARPTDSTAPTGSLTINSNAGYTNATSVTLNLSASDSFGVTGYYLSTNSTTPYASAVGWAAISSVTSYSANISYTVTGGDGTKTLYVWYKDAIGNVSNTYSDAIVLDTAAPTNGTFSVTPGDSKIKLSWSSFSDASSGIGSYTLVYSTSSTPNSCSTGTNIYSGTSTAYTHTGLTNNKTYYYRVCAADNAGNMSTGTTASAQPKTPDINLTLTPPSNTTASKGSRLGPFSISMKNNTSSSYPFYVYIYLVNPDGTWTTLISKSLTLSGGKTLTVNNLYTNIPSAISAGSYYYWVGIYDTSYSLIDYDYFAFTVTSSTSKSDGGNDWGVSGW
ncbi:MAG: fibronectin type III domain-containing protein [Nitrospirae bacterium]|nr:fibronectin type III domain-containing protein [Nitrospirota bacterium]